MFDLSQILVPAEFSLQATFGLDPNVVHPSIMVDGFQIPDPATLADPDAAAYAVFLLSAIPPIDPNYQFRKDLIRSILLWWATGQGDVMLLFGPTGTGKTSLIEQWCARLGIPLFMAKGHRRFEPMEAFGQFVGGEGGTTPWVDGPLTMAARFGLPVVINEYDRIAPDRAIVFNDVFEGRAFPLPGKSGEVVTPQPGFRVVLTANTNLVEDLSGNYGTANSHDISLLERLFAVQVGYPEAETERRLLEKELEPFDDQLLSYWFDQEGFKLATDAGIKEGSSINRAEFIHGLLEVADRIRKQSKDGGNTSDAALERTMSTRILRKWARSAAEQAHAPEKIGLSALHLALKQRLSQLATESTRIALHQAVESVFGVGEIIEE
mgnify:FL=1